MTELGFGSFAVSISVPAGPLAGLMEKAYAPFRRTTPDPHSLGAWRVTVRIAGSLPPAFERMEEVDRTPVPVRRDGERLGMDAGWFGASVDIPRRAAELQCPLSLHPLDSLLRVLFTLEGARAGSFLLHAAGIVTDGRAYAVFGPSGAGKSTIAAAAAAAGAAAAAAAGARANSACAIGDELIGLRLGQPSAVAHGTPFWDGRDVTCPLAALVVPVKSADTSAEAIGPGEALRLMWPQVQVAGLTSEELAAVWHAAAEIAASVRAIRLRFALGPRMWDEIREALGSVA